MLSNRPEKPGRDIACDMAAEVCPVLIGAPEVKCRQNACVNHICDDVVRSAPRRPPVRVRPLVSPVRDSVWLEDPAWLSWVASGHRCVPRPP